MKITVNRKNVGMNGIELLDHEISILKTSSYLMSQALGFALCPYLLTILEHDSEQYSKVFFIFELKDSSYMPCSTFPLLLL